MRNTCLLLKKAKKEVSETGSEIFSEETVTMMVKPILNLNNKNLNKNNKLKIATTTTFWYKNSVLKYSKITLKVNGNSLMINPNSELNRMANS